MSTNLYAAAIAEIDAAEAAMKAAARVEMAKLIVDELGEEIAATIEIGDLDTEAYGDHEDGALVYVHEARIRRRGGKKTVTARMCAGCIWFKTGWSGGRLPTKREVLDRLAK
jgi:hypothetical protein